MDLLQFFHAVRSIEKKINYRQKVGFSGKAIWFLKNLELRVESLSDHHLVVVCLIRNFTLGQNVPSLSTTHTNKQETEVIAEPYLEFPTGVHKIRNNFAQRMHIFLLLPIIL